jgi:hypothetical protein
LSLVLTWFGMRGKSHDRHPANAIDRRAAMNEYTKPALPEPFTTAPSGTKLFDSDHVEAHADACVAAYKAHIRAEQWEPVAQPEDAVHGRCAWWLTHFVFKHKRDPYPQEVWDAATNAAPSQPAPLTISREDALKFAVESGAWIPLGLPSDWDKGDLVFTPTHVWVFARTILAAAQEPKP